MKKQLIFLVTIFFATKSFTQTKAPGQLKITLVSARCINQSAEGIIEFDGHGNEIMAGFAYRVYNPANTSTVRPGSGGTAVFGSNVNGQTRAGSQTPNLGGINNGDVVPINQMLLNEHLGADDVVLFAPVLWEMDEVNNRAAVNQFNMQLANDLNWAITQPFPFATTPIGYTKPYDERVTKIFDKYRYGPALKYQSIFSNVLCPANADGNRVIGLKTGTLNNACTIVYPPTLLALDTRILMSVISYNKYVQANAGSTHPERPRNYISGAVEIVFTEETYAIEANNGKYSILLNIEFIPDVVPAPPAISKLPQANTSIKNNISIKNNYNNTIVSVVGNWSGTQTNSDGNYPQALAFQLTGNGEIIMANTQTGAVGAKGSYTFSQGNINGTYTLLSSGEVISFTGTLDPNTQKLNCSLGAGTSSTGQGRWSMNRN